MERFLTDQCPVEPLTAPSALQPWVQILLCSLLLLSLSDLLLDTMQGLETLDIKRVEILTDDPHLLSAASSLTSSPR